MKSIASVSQRAWSLTQELINDQEIKIPVELAVYSRKLAVGSIQFKRILSDAGLAKGNNSDYTIVINSDSDGALAEGTKLLPEDSDWAQLPPRLYFRVAHELAHLIFLQAANRDRQSNIFIKNERAVENACNILARLLLLPKEPLGRELENDIFDLKRVLNTLTKSRVAPEVFILRCKLSDLQQSFPGRNGMLALIQETGNDLKVEVCHMWGSFSVARFEEPLSRSTNRSPSTPISLAEQFRQPQWSLENQPIKVLRLSRTTDIEALIRSCSNQEINLDWNDRFFKCRFASCALPERPGFYLASLEIPEAVVFTET